jgi:hypothetical protein
MCDKWVVLVQFHVDIDNGKGARNKKMRIFEISSYRLLPVSFEKKIIENKSNLLERTKKRERRNM